MHLVYPSLPPPPKKDNFSSGVLQSSQEKLLWEGRGVNKVHYGLGENGVAFLAISLTLLYM